MYLQPWKSNYTEEKILEFMNIAEINQTIYIYVTCNPLVQMRIIRISFLMFRGVSWVRWEKKGGVQELSQRKGGL